MEKLLALLGGAGGLAKSKKGNALILTLAAIGTFISLPISLPLAITGAAGAAVLGSAYLIGQSIVDSKKPSEDLKESDH